MLLILLLITFVKACFLLVLANFYLSIRKQINTLVYWLLVATGHKTATLG